MRPDEDPTLGPSDEDAVRQVLASLRARAGETIPPDVAARLDETLAGLVAEGVAPTEGGADDGEAATGVEGQLVPLARRRRRWPQFLAAAAVVSVVALGVGEVLGVRGGFDATMGGLTESTSDGDSAAGAAGAPDDDAGEDAATESLEPGPRSAMDEDTRLVPVVLLRRATLTEDVQQVVDDLGPDLEALTAERGPAAQEDPTFGHCTVPALEGGDSAHWVRFEDDPAVLVLRDAVAGEIRAEVFACSQERLLAATTVHAP